MVEHDQQTLNCLSAPQVCHGKMPTLTWSYGGRATARIVQLARLDPRRWRLRRVVDDDRKRSTKSDEYECQNVCHPILLLIPARSAAG